MKKIFGFAKYDLKVASHIMVMQDFLHRISDVAFSNAKVNQLKVALASAIEREDNDYKADQGSIITPEIAEADQKRDRQWGAITSTANIYMREGVGTPEQREAAQVIDAVRSKFKVNVNSALADESATLNQAIKDLESRGVDFSLFGLSGVFADLKANNQKVFDYICKRQDERAALVMGVTKTNRDAVDAIYDELITYVEAIHLLNPTDEVGKFIDKWNSMVNYYRQQLLKAKTVTGDGGQVDIDTTGGEQTPQQGSGSGTTTTPTQPGSGSTSGSGEDGGFDA